jgi:DNA helicase-2/ATP-dependent DNA helicase PcrA
MSTAPPYVAGLNPEQSEAVLATEGPVLVLAGAGTGKTRVLTTRLSHILTQNLAKPWEVLAVTFTNKAASEMRERVTSMIGPGAERLWLGTFHSLGVRILRRHAGLLGMSSNFTILDPDDQLRLTKQLVEAAKIDPKKWPPNSLLSLIQRWKDRGYGPEQVPPSEEGYGERGRALYALYQQRLTSLNAVDFGDLLLLPTRLFTSHPEVAAEYQKQFRYILVDEYQDTNVAQYLWLRLLARQHRNICCVGDDDQSIYSWRGAEVGNILRFEKDFPGAKIIRLERNYRSTPHILGAAAGLIDHNRGRLGKTLFSGVEGEAGERISIRPAFNGEEEARQVGEDIETVMREGTPASQIAILVRTGAQTREFEERLMVFGLPYRVIGGPRFYERMEIRDALAYLRLVVQPADDLAFERIINVPKRGIGDATLNVLHVYARTKSIPLAEATKQICATDEIKPKAAAVLAELISDFDRWRDLLTVEAHAQLAARILEESGYIDHWKTQRTPDAAGRVENLRELIAAIAEFEDLPSFLEHVSLVMENIESAGTERISLMTLHGAKGLEFDVVFLPGWEEGLFPHQRSLDENGEMGLEEERRLAYVGITRAKKQVFISHASSRRVYNQWQNNLPSRFLEELPEAHIYRNSGYSSYAPVSSSWGNSWNSPRQAPRSAPGPSIKPNLDPGEFRPGDKIFHRKFGPGKVLEADGERLDILFDRAGRKTVMAGFVERK